MKLLSTSQSFFCYPWGMQMDAILWWWLHEGIGRSCRPGTPSPSSFFEQPFEILPSCSHQCFTVDAPEQTQAEASHAMPVFAFRKEWFDPHTAFAVRLLVGFSGVVRSHPIQILLMDTATERPSLLTGGTLCG